MNILPWFVSVTMFVFLAPTPVQVVFLFCGFTFNSWKRKMENWYEYLIRITLLWPWEGFNIIRKKEEDTVEFYQQLDILISRGYSKWIDVGCYRIFQEKVWMVLKVAVVVSLIVLPLTKNPVFMFLAGLYWGGGIMYMIKYRKKLEMLIFWPFKLQEWKAV